MAENTELNLAYKFVQYTNKNIFLTGKAGTGKTTFLKSLKNNTFKRMVVVAPTGVAAINAGGVTMHSFFQLPFGPILTEKAAGHKIENPEFKHKFNKTKINIIKTLDLLVIDEISMVRADMLDAVDEVLRRYKNRSLPFGGVQLLMIGDLQQLAPVVKEDDKRILSPYYDSLFFFNSKALKESEMVTLELKKVYRQADDNFLNILNEIRNDKLSSESFDQLHKRYIPDFNDDKNKGYIHLTSHNRSADRINEERLLKIDKKIHRFEALVEGNFLEHSYPTHYELELKEGAQVMFIKNDSDTEKRYFNGKIGIITGFENGNIIVKCDNDEEIYVGRERWENIRYTVDEVTKEIEEEMIGAFTQYPLKLAWAITIHKSQGFTFEKAIIDAADAFAHGQTYVALSRCKTLEGLVLSSKISENAIICDQEVNNFNSYIDQHQPDEEKLNEAVYAFQSELINELFNYRQLKFRFDKFEKTLREHAGAYRGNIGEAVLQVQQKALPEASKTGENFLKQVKSLCTDNPNIEQNTVLIERLKKAGDWFIKFHNENIINKLNESSFETDNRSVKKDIKESNEKVNELLRVKQKTLEVCLEGFNMKDFLHARALALFDEKDIKNKPKVSFRETESKHPELYQKLKDWRRSEAEPENIPFYHVASNRALHGIAEELPVTNKQLLAIEGIGKKKVEQYGNIITAMVSEYIQAKGLEAKKDLPEAEKPPKKKHWELSYELFKEGKKIDEIAQELGFVTATIENHLGRFVASGELKIEEFVTPEVTDKISAYFEKHPDSKLSDAKTVLPDDITWSQIKMVLKHMEYLKTNKY